MIRVKLNNSELYEITFHCTTQSISMLEYIQKHQLNENSE